MLKSLPFFSQIKTKHRYVWTQRESTEEGSTLGELVDQVCLLALQMSGPDVFFFSFGSVLLYLKKTLCVSLVKSFSSFLGAFLLVLVSLQQNPPPGFETCKGTNERCRLLLSLILIANRLAAC